ncbi:peptidase [Klebsiella variicola]|nr:peptidase [Klebsiella quasipneumoniae]PXK33440.1 peptidase [Klebsiella variicola]PXK77513.1 peptidase [Klebsiella variicola]PXM48478.1 peptidase [Klebsiella variicola]
MNSPNTQNIQDSVYFLADDYFLNRPSAQDHMLMIANISKLDHLLHRGCEKIY